jgi:type III secretion protein X
MPIKSGIERYSLDRGLESISQSSRPDLPLPDASHLPPADQLNQPELDRLLHQPNLRDFLAGELRPEISDRALLTPQQFERTLRQAAQTLSDASSAGGAAASPALKKAARALGEEANLRELLNMYRSTLFQG